MIGMRLLIFGIPLAAISLTWWSVKQSRASRVTRTGEITAMLPGDPPALHPFLPATEVDRQIIDLIHEPLIRIGADGKLKPALAERWEWSQTITSWFLTPEVAKKATVHLKGISADRWIEWNLESAKEEGSAVVMQFSKMSGVGPQKVLEELGSFDPLPAELVRIEVNESARPYHEHFMANAVEAGQMKRVWYDGANAIEIIAAGNVPKFFEELTNYYQSKSSLNPQIKRKDKIYALREPSLEIILREGIKWHHDTPFTAEDVRATYGFVTSHQWAIPNMEALRQIQAIEVFGASRLKISYRKIFGPAICGWVNLPILPASWIKDHPLDADGRAFLKNAPSGCGMFSITHRDRSSLALAPPPSAWANFHIRRLTFVSGVSAFQSRLGYATGSADLFWPTNEDISSLLKQDGLAIRGMPPRSRLVVLWNTQSTILSDVSTRKALALATDRQELINNLMSGRGRIHEGLFQPGLWFAKPIDPPLPNLHAAAEALSDAGWLKNVEGNATRPGQNLKFEILTTSGNPQRQLLAEALATQWKKIGVQVNITSLPWDEMVGTRLSQRRFDAAIIGLEFETTWDQLPFWHSTQSGPGGLNFCGVEDRQIDLLLEGLHEEFDPDQIEIRAAELDQKLSSLYAMLPLFTDMTQVAVRQSVLQKESLADDTRPWNLRDLVFNKPAANTPKVDLEMIMPATPKSEPSLAPIPNLPLPPVVSGPSQ
jgi:ABC-type transport system substrate-binding protein